MTGPWEVSLNWTTSGAAPDSTSTENIAAGGSTVGSGIAVVDAVVPVCPALDDPGLVDRTAVDDAIWHAWTECRMTCIDEGVFIDGVHTTEPACWDACDVWRDACLPLHT